MTILHPELAFYKALIDYEFSLYGTLINSIDEHIQSDLDGFISDLNEQAKNIEDEEVREDFFFFTLAIIKISNIIGNYPCGHCLLHRFRCLNTDFFGFPSSPNKKVVIPLV